LYHWFSLEAIGVERTSLSYSVFIPADSSDKLYYFDHASKKQGYAGVSTMPLKVKESRKEYDWKASTPVEFRAYVKEIAGRKCMFFLGTISSISDTNAKQFDGSATPDLVLIDSEYRDVIWIDVKHPSTWDEMVYSQLNEAWRSSEGIGYYFNEKNSKEDRDIKQSIDSLKIVPKINVNSDQIESLQRKLDSLKSLGN
jgi:hypothetical protein